MALRPFLPSFILILLLTGLSQGRKDARKFIGVSQAESLANIEKGIAYDMDGNIISLRRYGPSGLIEDLSYTYSGNCLSGIDDAVSSSTYVYQSDRNGNVTYDGKNSLSMTYDLNNLIKTVSSQGGQTEYAHLADGTKIWAYDGNTLLAYWGSFVYESRDTVQLESIGYSQGRIVPENGSGGRRTFKNKVYMSDQVGSTRVVLDIDNEESPVVEQNDYLPFGKRAALSGYVTDTTNRYRFNGKEEQAVIGVPYTDYGARLYDTFSARWLSQDPKAENYYGFSPYVFCGDNPVNLVDFDGTDIWDVDSTGAVVNHTIDKSKDMFRRVSSSNSAGVRSVVDSISFGYGTIQESERMVRYDEGKKVSKGKLTLFKVNGDQNATSLFEFILRAGSRVEWDLVGVGTRSNGSNFIGTMNNKKITSAVPYLFYSGYTIRSSSHYHPSSKYAPSGNDSYIKSIVTKKFPNATFTIMGFDVKGNSVYVSY